jgi:hypothetical protein
MHQVPDPGSGTQGTDALAPPRPAQPKDDLSGRPPWQAPDGSLAPDFAKFVQAGVSICVGACERGRDPVAGLGLACRLSGDGRLRLMLRRRGNERLLASVADGSPVAVTFTQPTTHRSIQLKASSAALAAPEPEDEPHRARQHRALRDELVAIGYSSTLATTYRACEGEELAIIVFVPEEAFVQTPGPELEARLP